MEKTYDKDLVTKDSDERLLLIKESINHHGEVVLSILANRVATLLVVLGKVAEGDEPSLMEVMTKFLEEATDARITVTSLLNEMDQQQNEGTTVDPAIRSVRVVQQTALNRFLTVFPKGEQSASILANFVMISKNAIRDVGNEAAHPKSYKDVQAGMVYVTSSITITEAHKISLQDMAKRFEDWYTNTENDQEDYFEVNKLDRQRIKGQKKKKGNVSASVSPKFMTPEVVPISLQTAPSAPSSSQQGSPQKRRLSDESPPGSSKRPIASTSQSGSEGT